MKTYIVNIDKQWSEDFKVKTKNMTEAKRKAWEKYIGKKPKKAYHQIYADQISP